MTTTHILVSGDMAYMLVSHFSDFTFELSFFALFCYAEQGKEKCDYVDAFESVKETFVSLTANRRISDWTIKPVKKLFENVTKLLGSETVNSTNLRTVYNLVTTFIDNEISTESPQSFKHQFLEEAIAADAKEYYSEGLFRSVDKSLEVENYDDAVLNAFKYLDDSLRKLAEIDSHQIYGEDLINRVFAPKTGLLKVTTHPNEQIGLRNWFSGANAIFRNPLAHRFVNLDKMSAFSAIAMIALMLKIAAELYEDNHKTNPNA